MRSDSLLEFETKGGIGKMFLGKMLPCYSKEAIVTIQTYQNGVMDGYLQHARLAGKEKVHSLSQMVLLLDSLLDLENCPNQPPPLVCAASEEKDSIAVFRIQILFREHYTWQGRLIWQNENQEIVFRSTLELIQILDEILAA